ncbi:uncharacterized protein LOC129552281 [Moschus berezovskii]|uniref:uncharacterized protein LOC129552281 n=1 Tax=Moschus berezovskii TaxID=68408 RepID=UPI00244465EC|nr:uncharacterized protein LOC129552281 [Moschus berezovskii]
MNFADVLLARGQNPHHLCFDGFFTSVTLVSAWKKKRVRETGTIHESRTEKRPLVSAEHTKTMKKGHRDFRAEEKDAIVLCRWDAKPALSPRSHAPFCRGPAPAPSAQLCAGATRPLGSEKAPDPAAGAGRGKAGPDRRASVCRRLSARGLPRPAPPYLEAPVAPPPSEPRPHGWRPQGWTHWATPRRPALRCGGMSESNLAARGDALEGQASGARVIAQALKAQDVNYMFGVVGIPVTEIALAAQEAGIRYVGMRNEQAACYAASAVGYLTGRPGVCLVVSGPGLIHSLGGMTNVNMNGWPLVVIGGSSERSQETMGAFQEFPQVEACRLYSKFSAHPRSLEAIPSIIEKAVRSSIYGRPGACYVDIPADFVKLQVNGNSIKCRLCPGRGEHQEVGGAVSIAVSAHPHGKGCYP